MKLNLFELLVLTLIFIVGAHKLDGLVAAAVNKNALSRVQHETDTGLNSDEEDMIGETYYDHNYIEEPDDDDDLTWLGGINAKRSKQFNVYRRTCIRRSGSCDNRPNDCCFNSSCRCNLWGSNCRCQRVGLFQKWG